MARKKPGLASIARHEAGHAVAALACGIVVGGVVVSDKQGRGCCGTARRRGAKEDPLVAGIIAWAGSVAEGARGVNEHDAAPFKRYGFCDRSVFTMRQAAVGLLVPLEAAVAAVARELEVRRCLFGPDVKRIACKAVPELRRDAPTYPRAELPELREQFVAMCRRYGVPVTGRHR